MRVYALEKFPYPSAQTHPISISLSLKAPEASPS